MYVSDDPKHLSWISALAYREWLYRMGLEETHNIIVDPFNWRYAGDTHLSTEEYKTIVKNRKRANVFCRG